MSVPAWAMQLIVSALGALGGLGFRIAYLRSRNTPAHEIREDLITSSFALIVNVMIAQFLARSMTSDFVGQTLITALVVGSGIGIANALMQRLEDQVRGDTKGSKNDRKDA